MGRLTREWQQQQQQQQQGQAAPGSALQQGGNAAVYQYGSAEADQAAARLMQLGVSVSPPGSKESITWDRLAGGCSCPARSHAVQSCTASLPSLSRSRAWVLASGSYTCPAWHDVSDVARHLAWLVPCTSKSMGQQDSGMHVAGCTLTESGLCVWGRVRRPEAAD